MFVGLEYVRRITFLKLSWLPNGQLLWWDAEKEKEKMTSKFSQRSTVTVMPLVRKVRLRKQKMMFQWLLSIR